MKLYTKGERRYREASKTEILRAAAQILTQMGIDDEANTLYGVSLAVDSAERNLFRNRTLTLEKNRDEPDVQ